jgi:predicted PurR-regulated permease PerM
MKLLNEQSENLITIFISLLSLILFGLLIYSSSAIISPIFLYILILIVFAINKNQTVVRSIFILSTIIFIVWFINELLAVLVPFIISFLIAYIINPLIIYFEKKKIHRTSGALISVLLILIIVGLGISFVIPPFVYQIGSLISLAPQKILEVEKYFSENILPELTRLGIFFPDIQKTLSTEIPAKLQSILSGLLNGLLNIFSGISFIFNQIINVVVIPVMTFYFLRDYDRILNAFLYLFSEDHRETVKKIGEKVNRIFGNYIRGYLIVSLINGTIITIGLTLIGVPYAVVLGILSALFNFVPYFGMIISVTIGFLISVFSGIGGIKLLLVPVLYIGENIVENYFISPKIIGEKVGLHPLLILFALFVFGYFGGLIGMLIGVPVTALLISFIDTRDYKNSV